MSNHILHKALNLHKEGRLKEAQKLYSNVLAQDPKNHIALYFNGLIYIDLNNTELAVKNLKMACNINSSKEYLLSLADLFFNLNQFKNAVEYYEMIIQQDNSDINSLNKLATAYYHTEKYAKSIELYKKILNIPGSNPCHSEIYYNLAIINSKLGQISEAIDLYYSALELKPDYPEAYFNLGCLYQKSSLDKALKFYLKAQELNLNIPNLYLNIGSIYLEKLELDKAIEAFKKAILLNSNYAEAFNNLGMAYFKQDQFDKAIEAYNKALELNPSFIKTYNNLGVLYRDIKQLDKAAMYLKRGTELAADYAECNYNFGAIQLLTQNFTEGWERYEYRFYVEEEHPTLLTFNRQRWLGEQINGKTIYIYYEQGFGDTLMFCRFLKTLANMGAKVIFRPQDQFIELFRASLPEIEITTDNPIKPSFDFDFYSPLLSLPGILKINSENIPFSKENYLKADPEKINFYKNTYFDNNLFKIGIFWQGNPKGLKNRAVPLDKLYPLFQIKGTKIYSFQKGYGQEQLHNLSSNLTVVDLGSTFDDFSDTAAALENLDLLISTDTSIVHLAGAMGKKTWIMLAAVPEWRWMLNTNRSSWYNNLKLYRQPELNDWESVVQQMTSELTEILAE